MALKTDLLDILPKVSCHAHLLWPLCTADDVAALCDQPHGAYLVDITCQARPQQPSACAQYFGNKPQQGPNPNVPSQQAGLQSDVSAPHAPDGGFAPNNAPQAFVNQQARPWLNLIQTLT